MLSEETWKSVIAHKSGKDLRYHLEKGLPPETRAMSGMTMLHYACAVGNAEAIEVLLEYGANPNTHDYPGSTPLMDCYGDPIIAQTSVGFRGVALLLKHGANVNLLTKNGGHPFTQACAYEDVEAARLMLEAGADTSQVMSPRCDYWEPAQRVLRELGLKK